MISTQQPNRLQKQLIQKSGAWFSYGDERLGQGRENVRLFLKNNPDIRLEIENKIKGVKAQAGGQSKDTSKSETSD